MLLISVETSVLRETFKNDQDMSNRTSHPIKERVLLVQSEGTVWAGRLFKSTAMKVRACDQTHISKSQIIFLPGQTKYMTCLFNKLGVV